MGKKTKEGPSMTMATLVLFAPLVVFIFFSGVYIGSSFVQSHPNAHPEANLHSRGLPGVIHQDHSAGWDSLVAQAGEGVVTAGRGLSSQSELNGEAAGRAANLRGGDTGSAPLGAVGSASSAGYTAGGFVPAAAVAAATAGGAGGTIGGAAAFNPLPPQPQLPPSLPSQPLQPPPQAPEPAPLELFPAFQAPQAAPAAPAAATAASPQLPNPRSPSEGRESFPANEEKYLTFEGTVDGPTLTFALWVWLDPESQRDPAMKTIASNKEAGCESHQATYGFALFVNEWETNDGQLLVEYGSITSGCNKLGSGQTGATVPYGKWFHVAVVWSEQSMSLYLDEKRVATTENHQKMPQPETTMTLGRYPDGQYPFAGNLSSLVVLDQAVTDAESMHAVRMLTQYPGSAWSRGVGQLTTYLSEKGVRFKGAFSFNEASVILNSRVKKTPGTGKIKMEAIDITGHMPPGKFSIPTQHRLAHVAGGGGGDGFADFNGDLNIGDLTDPSELTPELIAENDQLGRQRALRVKAGMQHAWHGYKQYAWGRDELKPNSRRGSDNWGAIGCTLVDSLDVLWLMGMKQEFKEARDWVAGHLTFERTGQVSVFETTIRELGGLLAAFDLSGDMVFLNKAADLGRRLGHAFDTPSGIPFGAVSLSGSARGSNAGWTGNSAVLAELGTLQVDFRYLSEMTGDKSFANKANRAFDVMCGKNPPHGLYPIYVSTQNGNFNNRQVTFGALGDSFYEYLLKVWVQGGKSEELYHRVYDRAMDGMVQVLLQTSRPSNLAYIADWDGNGLNHKMDHLVCFMGGSLALGAYQNPDGLDSPRAQRDLLIGKAITHTCYQMYSRMATGLSAEWVQFRRGKDFAPGPGGSFNILRPEAIESIFILHQLTKDPVYREWGWNMFQALEKYERTDVAYGSYPDVNQKHRQPDDRMESFFLAETMKYHYLLQAPVEDHGVDILRTHVFNTEAHPTSIFGSPRYEELKKMARGL